MTKRLRLLQIIYQYNAKRIYDAPQSKLSGLSKSLSPVLMALVKRINKKKKTKVIVKQTELFE